MSSGSSNSTILNMPDYGQGLEEALRAQVGVLSGSLLEGDLKGRTLQEIVEQYERPLRMSAAQIDNDVLRQTLLGGQMPIYKSISQDDIVDRRASTGSQATQIDYGGAIKKTGEDAGKVVVGDGEIPDFVKDFSKLALEIEELENVEGAQRLIQSRNKLNSFKDKYSDEIKDKTIQGQDGKSYNLYEYLDKEYVLTESLIYGADPIKNYSSYVSDNYGIPDQIFKKNNDIDGADGAYEQYKQSGGNLSRSEWGNQDFVVPKDEDGNFILEATNETEIPVGGVAAAPGELTGYTRAGTGLVDMLGDTRNVQEFTTRQATESDVAAGLASEVGESITEASGNRQSGFDEDGNFLGLAAMAEDIQRGNLSRQREADLADVERLSGRFQDVMADYKPATASGIEDAKSLLEQQFQNLSGMSKATQADVDAGNASEVGEMLQTGSGQGGPISIPNELDPMQYAMSGEAGLGKVVSDRDQGGRRVKYYEDSLRSALLGDAKEALSQGLTDRETRAIQNSARARSGLMGRTFDQSGAIDESKALIQEDNNRRMQNRAFAQSALGQEVGIQTGDVARAMTADQFNVGAKMDAERLDETLRQQGVGNYINAVGNLAQIEDKNTLDPFQAILGRAGGGSLQAGQGVFGQAGYGLQSGPQYLNPESGLGFISSMAANNANMYAANQAANASRDAGMMNMFGGIIGGIGGGLAGRS